MSDDSTGSRLPPPAFPPGSRQYRNSSANNTGATVPTDLSDAMILPDEPMPERDRSVENAIISPDDPMPPREDRMVDAVTPLHGPRLGFDAPVDQDAHREGADELPEFESDGGVVTGIGMDDHMGPEDLVSGGDPYVMDLVYKVGKLAEALRTRGEAGLRTSPEMDKFESTLRGYCVGYLTGLRAEDDPSPEY